MENGFTRDGEESSSFEDKSENKLRYSAIEKGKDRVMYDRIKEKKPFKYFSCDGSHWMRNCPVKAKLAAITGKEN